MAWLKSAEEFPTKSQHVHCLVPSFEDRALARTEIMGLPGVEMFQNLERPLDSDDDGEPEPAIIP